MLTVILAGTVLGFYLRWLRSPYSAVGKRIAWSIGFAEAAYNFDVVLPGKLYRSARPDERFLRYVHETYGVRHIVNLSSRRREREADREAVRKLGMEMTGYHWRSRRPPALQELKTVLDIIDRNGPVLVHCASGSDRTGYTIAAYRILRESWGLDKAVQEMKRYWHNPARSPRVHDFLAELTRRPES